PYGRRHGGISARSPRGDRGRSGDHSRYYSADRELRRSRQLDGYGEGTGRNGQNGFRFPDWWPRSASDEAGVPETSRQGRRHRERLRELNRQGKSQEEITQTLIKEFNYGSGFEAAQIPLMILELK